MKSTIAAAILALACTTDAFSLSVHREASTRTQTTASNAVAVVNEEGAGESRRAFRTAVTTLAFTVSKPSASNAVYGADAKIEMPDIVQDMSDRMNKQCLVESLGTRQCLVYLDPENQLYKGTNGKLLFERLGCSAAALKDVPAYIETKQWNKVQGVLTGPMGTLSSTMNELTKNVEDAALQNKVKSLSVDVRKELYAISGASDRKNQKEAQAAFEKAELKLENFVSLVSSV